MEELRLPWNNKEGFVYGAVIAAITSVIMCEFNVFKTAGTVDAESFMNGLVCVPFIWAVAMVLMTLIVGRVADSVVRRFTEPSDSFYTKIVFNIIPCVLMLSATMTIIGPMIGHILGGSISLEPIYEWPGNWPVNFCVAFWVEIFVAQPAARHVMKTKHIRMLKASSETEART